MRDSGEGQMGYWRRKASEWFRVISRAYESFPSVLPLMGIKKTHNKAVQWPHRQLFWAVYGISWDIHTGERSVVDEAAGRCFLSPDLRLKEEECSSSASAFQELGLQISCCFLQTEHFRYFFFNLVTQQRDAHLGRNDLSGPTAARLGSSLEEKQYFLLLWQPQAKQFLIGWKRHSSSAYVEKHEDLKKKVITLANEYNSKRQCLNSGGLVGNKHKTLCFHYSAGFNS